MPSTGDLVGSADARSDPTTHRTPGRISATVTELSSVTLALILPGVLCVVGSLLASALPTRSPVDGTASPRVDVETVQERV